MTPERDPAPDEAPHGILAGLREPIVQAPMAGGPSTPELAAAVSNAGGLGFLALSNKSLPVAQTELTRIRELTGQAFGVNLLIASREEVDERVLHSYAEHLASQPESHGIELAPSDASKSADDGRQAMLDLIESARPPVVSFAFGCPVRELVDGLHAAGSEVWVTVTEPAEARQAEAVGADALVVQGVEAGGHRGSFLDVDGHGELGLLPLLRLVAGTTDLPLVAAGGLGDARAVAGALAAGAAAAQLGTAFLSSPEAGTPPAHRAALTELEHTGLTRAFTGRRARGLINRFQSENTPHAPSAYPQVAQLTAPLRSAALERDDAAELNLWAGQAHALTHDLPAGELVSRLGAGAREALMEAATRWA